MEHKFLLIACCILGLLSSCGTYRPCRQINYTSIRPTIIKDPEAMDEADIAVFITVSSNNGVDVLVRNLTDEVLTIDQTKSFFVNSGHRSTAYYDPTVRTESTTSGVEVSKGGSFNLGGMASAFNIGGVAGSMMNATTLGGSTSTMNSSTYTKVMADLPKVSIAPRGEMYMSKTFKVDLPNTYGEIDATPENSPITFSVSLCYSFGDDDEEQQITSDFYCNSYLGMKVLNRKTNDAVRSIIYKKPNAFKEIWYRLTSSRGDCAMNHGVFLNYQ